MEKCLQWKRFRSLRNESSADFTVEKPPRNLRERERHEGLELALFEATWTTFAVT
jgi:hypothetical protein